jgi:hypothetical protein
VSGGGDDVLTNNLKPEPRRFQLGDYQCLDHGSLVLAPPDEHTNEIVTLRNADGRGCEVAATSWGFYLGPSLNARLEREGFRAALMVNPRGQVYLVAVDLARQEAFQRYLSGNGARVLVWVDDWLASLGAGPPQAAGP